MYASGKVSEIATDTFFLDGEFYLIGSNFSDEITFNGQKIRVTGTDETLISVELLENGINIVENGGAAEIDVSGSGDLGVDGRVIGTSAGFLGALKSISEGSGYSVEKFVETIEGELDGLEISGVMIESEDGFSVTSDGEND